MSQPIATGTQANLQACLNQASQLHWVKRSGGGNRWYVLAPFFDGNSAGITNLFNFTAQAAADLGSAADFNVSDGTLSLLQQNTPDSACEFLRVKYNCTYPTLTAKVLGD